MGRKKRERGRERAHWKKGTNDETNVRATGKKIRGRGCGKKGKQW